MSDPLRAALERAATLFKLRATGNDTEWGAAARTWLAEYAALVAPPPREEDDDPAMKGDGTDRLCRALYGRDAKPRDYLGGSEARMLYDAAERIEAAAPRDGNAERRAGAPPEERFALTTTGEATATVGDVRSAGGRERVTIMDPKAQRPSGPETARLIEFARSRAASAQCLRGKSCGDRRWRCVAVDRRSGDVRRHRGRAPRRRPAGA